MKFQIGAMSVGDILDRALKIMLPRLPVFYTINLIALLPILVFQLILPLLQTSERRPDDPTLAFAFLGWMLLTFALAIILQPIASAAILHIIAQDFIGQKATIGDALRFALHRFGRLLWASLLAGLTIIVGFFLCCVPGILFSIWYVFVAQVVVVEALKSTDAMNRSKELTTDHRARIFGIFVILVAVQMILNFVAYSLGQLLPGMELVQTPAGPRVVANLGNQAIVVLVNAFLGILVQTYFAVCWTLFYFDLRIRKEGFDLELAAQQQSAGAH